MLDVQHLIGDLLFWEREQRASHAHSIATYVTQRSCAIDSNILEGSYYGMAQPSASEKGGVQHINYGIGPHLQLICRKLPVSRCLTS